jgi:hypothetical protein
MATARWTAVLVQERSTGKLGIAIVHSPTGKVTILGAGIGVGNGGDNFEWMDSWQVYSKTRAAHAEAESSVHIFAATHFWLRRAKPPAR